MPQVIRVPLTGNVLTLTLGALLYTICSTTIGLIFSTFMKSQIAAIFATAIGSILPAVQFSGLINPITSLEGAGAVIARVYPTTYFISISRGVFSKALGFADLYSALIALAVTAPVLMLTCIALLKKQEG